MFFFSFLKCYEHTPSAPEKQGTTFLILTATRPSFHFVQSRKGGAGWTYRWRSCPRPNVTGTGHREGNDDNSAVTCEMSNTGHVGFTDEGL